MGCDGDSSHDCLQRRFEAACTASRWAYGRYLPEFQNSCSQALFRHAGFAEARNVGDGTLDGRGHGGQCSHRRKNDRRNYPRTNDPRRGRDRHTDRRRAFVQDGSRRPYGYKERNILLSLSRSVHSNNSGTGTRGSEVDGESGGADACGACQCSHAGGRARRCIWRAKRSGDEPPNIRCGDGGFSRPYERHTHVGRASQRSGG
ncbi:hypothetical protein JCM10003_3916 [Bacteroides pyogenes JCM 10003]|nr:hypothetical protein JCM10003_3916 [Bacteroides pyogenes JCM 10003]